MRGGSHGDWNRFLCSQILGAERDTMLLGSRQPSVSSSNPTKTTPGEMLPGGVAVVVAASPGTARAGLGHGARSRAPTPTRAASCSEGPRHAGRSRRLLASGSSGPGAGGDALEAWGRSGAPTGDSGPEAVDAFGALARGGECAAARYVREVRRRPTSRGRWHGVGAAGGTSLPRDAST